MLTQYSQDGKIPYKRTKTDITYNKTGMTISERIFRIMEERGMSQIEFSRRTGISQSTISDWKRKNTNPAADKIMAICDALDVTPYDILQDSSKPRDEHNYLAVSQGTTEYELLVEIETLDMRQKERLKGYLNAIMEKLPNK